MFSSQIDVFLMMGMSDLCQKVSGCLQKEKPVTFLVLHSAVGKE